jgi:hypothetical protein
MEKIINTLYGNMAIKPTFDNRGFIVYDSYDNYLGELHTIPYHTEESLDEHYNEVAELITDAIDQGILSMPSEPNKDKGIWVLNVLESYGGLPPTAKASLYSEEKDVLSAKDDVVHEKLDEFAKHDIKYELMDEEGITELRSVQGDIYVCITYSEKEVN